MRSSKSASARKTTTNLITGISSVILIRIISICCIGVIFNNRSISSATTPLTIVPLDTMVYGTFSAAKTQTRVVSTLIVPPDTPTAFILPTFTFSQQSGITTYLAGADCVPNTPPQTGTVVEVVDGDTIKVRLDSDGITYSIRYIGIDTPESTIQHEAYGKEASEKNTELVSGKKVTMFKDVSETDKYDRLLCYVFTDTAFVNYELVKQGFANAVTYPPDVACANLFREAEGNARINLLGLWALQPLATAPSLANTTQSVIIVSVNKSAEYVDIKNVGSSPVNLNGWSLVSERGNQRCGLSGILEPGQTLRIWAGTGTDDFSCGFDNNIWNNNESDPAVLLDTQGKEVDRY